MPDTMTQQVTLDLNVKAAPGMAQPMKDLGEATRRAAENEKVLSERLQGVTGKLRAMSDIGSTMDKLALKSLFGWEKVDIGIKKATDRASDGLRKLKLQMSSDQFKLDADPTRLLATLRRVQGDIMKLQTEAKAGVTGALSGFERAGGGLMGIARGATLLSGAEGEDAAKMFARLMKFEAVVQILHGLNSVLKGTVAVFQGLTKATKGAAAAQGLMSGAVAAETALAQAAAGSKLGVAAANDKIAVSATRAALAETALGAATVQGAAVSTAAKAAEAAGAGRNWGAVGTGGAAAGGGAAAAGGGGIASAAMNPLTLLALGIGAVGANVALANEKINRLVGEKAAPWLHPESFTAVKETERYATLRHTLRTSTGMGDPEAEARSAHQLQLRQPFEDRQRALNEQLAGVQSHLAAQQAVGPNTRPFETNATKAQEAARRFNETLALSHTRPEPTARDLRMEHAGDLIDTTRDDATKRRQAGLRRMGLSAPLAATLDQSTQALMAAPKASVESQRALMEIEQQKTRALQEQESLNERIIKAQSQRRRNLTEEAELQRQLQTVGEKVEATERSRLQTLQSQRTQMLEQLNTQHSLAKAEAEQHRHAAAQARDKLSGEMGQVALEDPLTKGRALEISRRIRDKKQLTPDQLEFAKGHQLFGEAVDRIGREKAAKDPMTQEIFKNLGKEQKVKQQEEAAKVYANIQAKLETKIEATIRLNEADLARELAEKLVPQIHQIMRQSAGQLQGALNRDKADQQIQQFQQHANGRAPHGG